MVLNGTPEKVLGDFIGPVGHAPVFPPCSDEVIPPFVRAMTKRTQAGRR